MSSENSVETPKPEAIVALPVEPDIRLGSLAVHNPEEMVSLAARIATALAEVINAKKLYVLIQKRKYVMCEGWTTMGGLIGVLPIEEYCRRLPEGDGFEAKVNIIRIRDGAVIGGASAECSRTEATWAKRDSHSLRSMALTRATGKAYRLGFSWLIKLAGFSPTPAEEMMAVQNDETEQEVIQEVERQKQGSKATEVPKTAKNGSQAPANTPTTLFWTAPDQYNGHRAVFVNLKEYGSGLNEIAAEGLRQILKNYAKYGREDGEIWVPTGKKPNEMDALLAELEKCGVKTKKLGAADARRTQS